MRIHIIICLQSRWNFEVMQFISAFLMKRALTIVDYYATVLFYSDVGKNRIVVRHDMGKRVG